VNGEDDEFFKQQMADVQPLKKAVPTVSQRGAERTPGQSYRREAAQRAAGKDDNFLTTDFIEFVHPQTILSFKRDGIQNGVFRRLQRGGYDIEATLDLHRLTVEQARVEVFQFIRDCMRYDVRTALINHGKGGHADKPAFIKSCVAKWLPMFPEIMAFHSAQKFHGGVGAVYVLLRKSEKQKELSRQKLGLSSSKPQL
jgi:DNA-nicking Smr family endonuclease